MMKFNKIDSRCSLPARRHLPRWLQSQPIRPAAITNIFISPFLSFSVTFVLTPPSKPFSFWRSFFWIKDEISLWNPLSGLGLSTFPLIFLILSDLPKSDHFSIHTHTCICVQMSLWKPSSMKIIHMLVLPQKIFQDN